MECRVATAQNAGPGTAGKALVRTGGTLAPRNLLQVRPSQAVVRRTAAVPEYSQGPSAVSTVGGHGGRMEGTAGTGGGPGQR